MIMGRVMEERGGVREGRGSKSPRDHGAGSCRSRGGAASLPAICPPSKSIRPSPSVSAAWIMASASSSVSGAVGPLLGMVDRTYLGQGGLGSELGACGRCPGVHRVLTPHFTGLWALCKAGRGPLGVPGVLGWVCSRARAPPHPRPAPARATGCYLISFHSMKPLLSLSRVWKALRMAPSSCPDAWNCCMYSKNLR